MKNLLRSVAVSALLGISINLHAADYPKQVLWGDTHNHTSYSFDVYLFGTLNSTPDIAYRFAKGETVKNPATGTRWQLSKPLDFLVVADHAEMLGSIPRLFVDKDPNLVDTKTGQAILKLAPNQTEEELLEVYSAINYVASNKANKLNVSAAELMKDMHAGDKRRTAWDDEVDAAERHNQPGKFTTLIGFEWSSNTGGANLHRVVFQAEGGDVARQYLPFSSLESDDPEKLWQWLDSTSTATGATFVAIPHNPNISLGMMFPLKRHNGNNLDAAYAKERTRWERVVEATQIKGDSESHPLLSPNDEFANYEIFDFALTPDKTRPAPTSADYVRSGLQRGLELGQSLGTNPYKLGMIGSTDSHTGIAAIEETNFAGKGQHDNVPEKRAHLTGIGASKGWDMGAAGWAAVWATENTREAIVDAFKRREVYASTGPRISLRFFAGSDFNVQDAQGDIAKTGYARGVPMGSDLELEGGKAPTFLVGVMKDPDAANLDRAQIIKGWVDKDGKSHERIFDVAVSGDRTIAADGRCKEAVGNTVDLTTGQYTNSVGASQLTAQWTDPEFDPQQAAFYYVRALEIPTPRYSLLDAIKLGIDVKETGHPATIQERVYSSPIWYTPK
ncbi:DUF3604 domain-containing protein [Aestuariicella hydrocarbonica]|uniref:DUF3604 domain-containing protein n=1 Tax=Pseudomaricurvus hydrocarbonicus TaxID=1470433 RepID=A0A9E5MFX2_9GAMM|nr:DUF3604 domain-containing protein [Aestuariicella hydrocarbonica]NHO63951.1 DUF3604 domain-containing protein [Aestuariicella hydrocarbonica]